MSSSGQSLFMHCNRIDRILNSMDYFKEKQYGSKPTLPSRDYVSNQMDGILKRKYGK
jgi:hypothetical protein